MVKFNVRRLNRWATFYVVDVVENRFEIDISTYYAKGEDSPSGFSQLGKQLTPEDDWDEAVSIRESVVCNCSPVLGIKPCRRCLNSHFEKRYGEGI